ncbi:stalk domain-containing protein [Caldisericum exile]|uniref:Copper amine oxidase-like N-terminal domain-containing protein n=1 Tax=Caldisericum exile (strain DSM 21853 / NBRC 104410 / AZM16c01) TaxID=511051 RepID=A0A7U6GFV3_CALEA|nr:stalk domain-containing protein [Caldisericum exile]BAL81630.1 hypothetical protein CSE_15040 [Caldisericum exile AZM16c01]
MKFKKVVTFFYILFIVSLFISPKEINALPTQIDLIDKQTEKVFYFDPIPNFNTQGTLLNEDAFVYKVGEIIYGRINENQSSSWYVGLKDLSGNILVQTQLNTKNEFSIVASVNKDGKYVIFATDSLTSPSWIITKEIYIVYNFELIKADIKMCSNMTSTVEGKVKLGNNVAPTNPITVSVVNPNKKLAVKSTTNSYFNLVFPGSGILGDSYLIISDGYPSSTGSDAIVYAIMPNYLTETWKLEELTPNAPIYNDEEGNLEQSIVVVLKDSKGNLISGKSANFIIGSTWQNPSIKEISEGVYKIYGGHVKGNLVEIYVKDIVISNKIVKMTKKLTYFNPYIEVDAKFSKAPYGAGPYKDLTLGKDVFDLVPIKIGYSLEINCGVFPVPGIKDPVSPKYTLKENYYVYKVETEIGPGLENHDTKTGIKNIYYVKSLKGAYIKIKAIIWERANKDKTTPWSQATPTPYNACCSKSISETFYLTSETLEMLYEVDPVKFEIGEIKDLKIKVDNSFSIVHVYMVNSRGQKLQDSITVSYRGGRERKTLSDLWFNPLHITGTNIPDLPILFGYDDNIDYVYANSNVIFKGISFNYITNYPLDKNSIVVEIFEKCDSTYPYCAILKGTVEVTPKVQEIIGNYEIYTSRIDKSKFYSGIDRSVFIKAPFTFKDIFINCYLNGKPLSDFGIDFSYQKSEDGKILLVFEKPIPYEEDVSQNEISVKIEAFNDDLTKEEVSEIKIPVFKPIEDKTPPKIEIISPNDGLLTNNEMLEVSGMVTDDTEVENVYINGEKVSISKGLFKTSLKLNEGQNVIMILARDIYGNEAKEILKVYLDKTPPTCEINYPKVTEKGKVQITGKTENDTKIYFRGNEIKNENGSFSIEVELSKGLNYFFFSFEDRAGNKAKTTIEIKKIEITKIILQVGNKNMYINSKSLPIDPGRETTPIIKNGRVLVPIRAIVESVGGKVYWDGSTQKVTILYYNTTIELWVGKEKALINGKEVPIDSINKEVKPEIINGRVMVPIRFIAESLGAEVEWDAQSKIVILTFIR